MKRQPRLSAAAAAAAAILLLALPGIGQKHPRELAKPPALAFKPDKPVSFTLSNGIQGLYFEDKELPLVWMAGRFEGGSLWEPAEKAGLASLLGTVLRTGGTKTRTGDQINEELEFIAATVEATGGSEYLTVSANGLKKDFPKLVEVYADLVMNPAFPQDKLDLARNQSLESMRRRWDQPFQVANMLAQEKIFGGDTPWGRRATPATLKAVAREDLAAFHGRFFAPNNLTIGVVGDVSLAEVKAALEKAFQGWPKKTVALPPLPALVEKADGTVYYAFKDT
ncbi:MAG: insulinase family protein, partial [Candidatus Aminicenantes bacterium]|nr:insulinase family protein [Candidatus Aminicenantes bacterium]